MDEIRILPGGSALNVACAMKNAAPLLQQLLDVQQAVEVSFFSVVGNDALGKICRDHVQQLGVPGMKILPECTTGFQVAAVGTRTSSVL